VVRRAQATGFARLKSLPFLTSLLLTAGLSQALAAKAAVFDFELKPASIEPPGGFTEQETARLEEVTQRLREHLTRSGKFELVDIARFAAQAAASNLQACGNCADKFARELGADYAFTGVVLKMSDLILTINVYVHEAESGLPMASATVDIRGNTDEAWRRGLDYLYENVLSKRLAALP
jgi:hypothetical protein